MVGSVVAAPIESGGCQRWLQLKKRVPPTWQQRQMSALVATDAARRETKASANAHEENAPVETVATLVTILSAPPLAALVASEAQGTKAPPADAEPLTHCSAASRGV